MHLTLDREALAKALAFATKITDRRTTIPIIANVRLTAEGGRLSLAATDLDIEAQTSLAADIKVSGDTTVAASTLHEIIRKLAGGSVTLESDGDKGRLLVKSGRAKFQLATLPVEDWPTLERGEMTHKFSLSAESVARGLKKTTFAISNEETRYYLNGVYMHVADAPDAPMLRMVATDGHRLARIEMMAPRGSAGMPGVIIPTKACTELARMAEAAIKDKNAEIAIEVRASKIAFRCGDSTLLSKLIDGSFPDYTRVIPTQNGRIAIVPRADLAAAVDRVSAITSERGRAVKLSFDGPRLTLSVVNPDTGDATEETEIDFDNAPVEIGFNHKYLADALAALDGETARIELNDSGSPTLLRTAPNADLLIVLMPMRVN